MTAFNPEYALAELFAGRATPLQKKLLEDWLRQEGNAERYYQYLAKWEAEHAPYAPDTDAALAAYESFLAGQQPYPRHQPRPLRRLPVWRGVLRTVVAVAAVLTVVLGTLYLTHGYWGYERHVAPYGRMLAVRLPDGTDVTLNAHSELRVPRFGFDQGKRDVWLDGEAYFRVRRTPDRRKFTVHTAHLDVRVLGTQFNVHTRRGQTEVTLNEGKVQLVAHQPGTRPLQMKPGDYAALTDSDTTFRRRVVQPEQFVAWRQSRMVFDETPLSQVAQRIEDYYGVRVVLANRALAQRHLTGTLPNNDLNVVLKTLSVSYNLAVVREKDRIVLR